MSEQQNTFRWLNATQFFGALNDNIFKFIVIFFMISINGENNAAIIMGKTGLTFVLPFLIFSHLGGYFADRFSKKRVIVYLKALEAFTMSIGLFGFYYGSINLLLLTLFLMATQSAIFGPSKYGIIPEIVDKEQLTSANSQLISLTFLAIILGTSASPWLSQIWEGNYFKMSFVCFFISIIGIFTSTKIAYTKAVNGYQKSSFNPFREIRSSFTIIKNDSFLFLAVLGNAYFLFVGAFIQLNIIPFGIDSLGLTKEDATSLFVLSALGIGIGSFITGKISKRNIEFGIVPVGSFLIAISCIALWALPVKSTSYASLWVFILGLGSGFFIVPLETFIQYRSPKESLGEVLATTNWLSFIGVLVASVLILLFDQVLNWDAISGFGVMGLLTFGLTIFTFKLLPDFFLRFLAWLFMRIFYRLNIQKQENLPSEGGALLVCNHVSWVDALIVTATTQRRIRFIMQREIYNTWWLKPFMNLVGILPISTNDSPRTTVKTLKQASNLLKEGYLVCIFAEGQISRSGNMTRFRTGLERIAKGTNVPIIPLYLGGVWGSMFSYSGGQPFKKLPNKVPYPVTVFFGKPLKDSTSSYEVYSKVMELSSEYFETKRLTRPSLATQFIKQCQLSPHAKCINDTTGKELSFKKALIGSLHIKNTLNPYLINQTNVGLLLPTTVIGALTNISVTMLAKVGVNLNYTTSEKALNSAIKQCEIKTIITSKKFIEKIGLDLTLLNIKIRYVEEIIKPLTLRQKIKYWFLASFINTKYLDDNPRYAGDKTATIMFSSGSTSEPKGIILTHHNIISNIEGLTQVFPITANDNLCAALPFFHSFGYTATLWFPLTTGFSASFHTNPLEGQKIAEVVKENKSTLLLATPTFLMTYLRKATVEDFSTLRSVIVGAEKLKEKLKNSFIKRFNIPLFEGYGATELSPMVSVNLPDIKVEGKTQSRQRNGSVGLPLPGITLKITDPQTNEILGEDEEGLLFVKGPNVMEGYLNNEAKTKEVLQNGWYCTGDIARIDKDGFITITDRLSRFSKIGGEMIPHLAIEEVLLKNLPSSENILAVAAVPDEKRGEKIIVLYVPTKIKKEDLLLKLESSELPNLWKPKSENFIQIESIPVLGSGKVDLKSLKTFALS